jgi:hypothetical protein
MAKGKTVAEIVREKIEASEEGYWAYADFSTLPSTAVSKALSRMSNLGILKRVSKGIYYRPRQTRFGHSHPSQAEIQKLATKHRLIDNLHPSGISAANLLGFTTQNVIHGEFATSANSAPRKIIGYNAKLHTRRPSTWDNLSNIDASLLDFLRNKGKFSDLSPDETKHLLLKYFREESRFERILEVALNEPPRVRAMLGAIGQELRKSKSKLKILRDSLNPISRFDFGALRNLRYAKEWQAK